MIALAPVIDWFTLGLILGVDYHTLEKIRIQHRDRVIHYKSDMLIAWLQIKGSCTKQQLLNAFRYLNHSLNEKLLHGFFLLSH